MARTGISKSRVQEARDQLIAEGRYPSADAVRAALGNTGSKSTIHRYLKEMELESAEARASRQDTEHSLQTLIGQIADKLHSDAEKRMRAITASFEEALRQKDAEIAELHEAIAMLSVRLHAPVPAHGKPEETPASRAGFGHFDSLASASRSGQQGNSAFSIMLHNDRATLPDINRIRPTGVKIQ